MSESSYDKFYEKFVDFKVLQENEIDLTEAICREYDDGSKEYRMDVIWYLLQKLTSGIGNDYGFKNLFKFSKIALVTPHSNAGIEQVYSLVNKNKKEGLDRNRLEIDGSLSSILAVKLDRPEVEHKCYDYEPSKELLAAAKTTIMRYNTEH